jgi:hypothetical protein
MDITTHACFLPPDDPDTSLGCDRDTLRDEVRDGIRWITIDPADQLDTSTAELPVRREAREAAPSR